MGKDGGPSERAAQLSVRGRVGVAVAHGDKRKGGVHLVSKPAVRGRAPR